MEKMMNTERELTIDENGQSFTIFFRTRREFAFRSNG
jgi:hypothetical protein